MFTMSSLNPEKYFSNVADIIVSDDSIKLESNGQDTGYITAIVTALIKKEKPEVITNTNEYIRIECNVDEGFFKMTVLDACEYVRNVFLNEEYSKITKLELC